eukprot:234669-Pleurochrysis_carterae.AAC.4
MLAQLEKRGFVKNLGEAVGHLVACVDEVRLARAVIELALAEAAFPALAVLSLLQGACVVSLLYNRKIVHEQHNSACYIR